ncbi:heterokaryon incompatibility protein-domain-containing protein [Pyrenochaeta sp. MPI-SDFR-AT-0127]|nr:heterokaryon incompatibility protein-domain-containing protein [Pyrenochaeta sp. MPI-SDFR-AT-0127]
MPEQPSKGSSSPTLRQQPQPEPADSQSSWKPLTVAGQILKNMTEEDHIGPSWLLPFVPYVEKNLDSSRHDYSQTKDSEFNPVDLVRKWLDTCEKVHKGRCGMSPHSGASPWSGPLLLIDVRNHCIVATPTDARYIALSYTWGQDDASASATSQNIAELQKLNGLDMIDLPRTIKDSMHFIHQIGERYLWVDRLCIVQDELAKQSQLNAMGNIYAGAYFTLIAAKSTDASGPLYSDRSSPWPRKLKRPPSLIKHTVSKENSQADAPKLSGKKIIVTQAQYLMRSRWYSRSWTFQEYLFSKRRVVFQGDTVNWECLYEAWHELQEVSTQDRVLPPYHDTPLTGFKTPPWPDMLRFARLVSIFSIRNLTFPEDILDAFAGVLSHLSRTFQHGFISGLPQMCFDAALLWQPWKGTLKRRKSVGCLPSEAILPSWSWVGWTGGALNSESWRSAANYQYEHLENPQWKQCSWKTISTVSWLYSISLTSTRKPIRIAACQSSVDHESDALPTGWSKSDQGQYYHVRCLDEPFRYPIPIRDPYIAHTPPISARYLHCVTKRATLTTGGTFTSSASQCTVIDLFIPTSGAWAGVLRLNQTMEDANGLLPCQDMELIEISMGRVENNAAEQRSFDEWMRGSWPDGEGEGTYEFYNVLWIEWIEGVAYRKACGRVERGVWEGIERDSVEVTLG